MVDLARSFGFNVPFAAVAAPLGVYAITSKFNVPIHGLKTVAAVEIVNQVINNTKLAQIFSNTTVAPVQASKGFMGAMAERTPLDVRKQLANLHREYSGQYVQQRSGLTQERNGMGRKYLR